jgi:hypothetical protein
MTTIAERTQSSEEAWRKLMKETSLVPRQSWFYAGLYEFVLRWLDNCIEERSEFEPDDLLGKMFEYAQQFEEDGDVADFHPVKECVLLGWHDVAEDFDDIIHENIFYGVVGLFLHDEFNKHSVARQKFVDEEEYFTDSKEADLQEDSPRCVYDMDFCKTMVDILHDMGESYQEWGTIGDLERAYENQTCCFVGTNVLPPALFQVGANPSPSNSSGRAAAALQEFYNRH